MQWSCRQEIEDALWLGAKAVLSPSALSRKAMLEAIRQRSALYTSERDLLVTKAPGSYSEADLAARALFFSVADTAKISIPLAELAGRDCLPSGTRWRVLDLGAGAGAMGLGLASFVLDYHPGVQLEIDAVDLDEKALAIYAHALRALSKEQADLAGTTIRTRLASVSKGAASDLKYDLILMGSVLNELPHDHAAELVTSSLKLLADEGALIAVEPALRETSRALHAIRDKALASNAFVFAPCTHQNSQCHALADARDWCHEDRAFVLPELARQMAMATGLRDGGLKFSYLTLRVQPVPLVEPTLDRQALRVVSQPQRSKGQRECFTCGESGRKRTRMLKRNRSSTNREAERAKRGDVLLVEGKPELVLEAIELQKADIVRLLKPAELV